MASELSQALLAVDRDLEVWATAGKRNKNKRSETLSSSPTKTMESTERWKKGAVHTQTNTSIKTFLSGFNSCLVKSLLFHSTVDLSLSLVLPPIPPRES